MKQLRNKFLILLCIAPASFLQTIHADIASPSRSTETSMLNPTIERNLSQNPTPINPEYINSEALNRMAQDSVTVKPEQSSISFNASAPTQKTSRTASKTTPFDPSAPANYPDTYQNEFMNFKAIIYKNNLQKQFPSASPDDISNYTNEFLKTYSGQYEQKTVPGYFSNTTQNDLAKPLKITIADINNPELRAKSSSLQKLYDKMTHDNSLNIQTPEATTQNTPQSESSSINFTETVTKRFAQGAASLQNYTDYLGNAASSVQQDEPSLNMQDAAMQHVEESNRAAQSPHTTPEEIAHQTTQTVVRETLPNIFAEPLVNAHKNFIGATNSALSTGQETASHVGQTLSSTAVDMINRVTGHDTNESPLSMQAAAMQHVDAVNLAADKASTQPVNNSLDITLKTPYLDAILNPVKAIQDTASATTNYIGKATSKTHQAVSNVHLAVTNPSEFVQQTIKTHSDSVILEGVHLLNSQLNPLIAEIKKQQEPIPLNYPEDFNTPLLKANLHEQATTDLPQDTKIIEPTQTASADQSAQENTTLVKTAKSISTTMISTFTGYLINALQETAKAARGNVPSLKLFMNKLVVNYSQVRGLSPKNETVLQHQSTALIDVLVKDTSSWFYASDEKFSQAFSRWMTSIIKSFDTSSGKGTSTGLRIIQIEPLSSNPSTPKTIINYDKITGKPVSATIEYQGNTFTVSGNNFTINENGTFSFKTPLYTKPQNPGIIQGKYNDLYNSVVKNSIFTPFRQSQAGKIVAKTPGGADLLQQTENTLTTDDNPYDRTLKVTCNATGSNITTVVSANKLIDALTSGTIITTKNYVKGGSTTQTIELTGPTADLFSPSVTITNCSLDSKENPLATIKHENKQTGQTLLHTIELTLDPKTGIYTGIADQLQPTKAPDGFLVAAILPMIKDPSIQAQAKPILENLETQIAGLSAEGLKQLITNANKSVLVLAQLKNIIGDDAYNNTIAFLTAPIPTAIERETIAFNKDTGAVATRTITTMSAGAPQKTDLTYQAN